MNGATAGLTPGQLQAQAAAAQQMQDFWQTASPALSFGIESAKTNEPALEQLASGAAAGSADKATGMALGQNNAQSTDAGARPGSGAYITRAASALTGGAGASGIGQTLGTLGQKGIYFNRVNNFLGAGNQMQQAAIGAVNQNANVTGQEYGQNIQQNEANANALASLGLSIGKAGLSFPSSPAAPAPIQIAT